MHWLLVAEAASSLSPTPGGMSAAGVIVNLPCVQLHHEISQACSSECHCLQMLLTRLPQMASSS